MIRTGQARYWNPTKQCVFYGGPMHMQEFLIRDVYEMWYCYVAVDFGCVRELYEYDIPEPVKISRAVYKRVPDGFVVNPFGISEKFCFVFSGIIGD